MVLRCWGFGGSGGGIRTRDPTIMSRVLLPTELLRRVEAGHRPAPPSPLTDSNRRPLPYHGSALPTELRGRSRKRLAEHRRAPALVLRPSSRASSLAWAPMRTRLAEPRDAEATRMIYNLEVLESTVTFDLVPRSLDRTRWRGSPSTRAVIRRSSRSTTATRCRASRRSRPFGPARRTRRRSRTPCTCAGERRGDGIGELLLRDLLDLATDHGFHSVIARIVGGHDASIKLHDKCGFEQVGAEREVGRKFGRWLDVVLMQKML